MTELEAYKEHIQHTHNAYCKIVICLAGNGPTKIARMLTERQIPTPGTLEYRRTGSTRRYHPGYECKWATNTLAHILSYFVGFLTL